MGKRKRRDSEPRRPTASICHQDLETGKKNLPSVKSAWYFSACSGIPSPCVHRAHIARTATAAKSELGQGMGVALYAKVPGLDGQKVEAVIFGINEVIISPS